MSGIWGLSKKQSHYRPATAPEFRCDHCAFMFPRFRFGGCRLVRGVIRASDTCDKFRSRGAAAAGGTQDSS
jgi:hypothetical protein